jgi:hypothetical protein
MTDPAFLKVGIECVSRGNHLVKDPSHSHPGLLKRLRLKFPLLKDPKQ